MDTVFPAPAATPFEVVSAILSALLYLAVGCAAIASYPRDARARLFLTIALTSAAPFSVTVLLWMRGSHATFTLPVIIVLGLSLTIGSVALLHFAQLFPWRRPWIRAHWGWLAAGYVFAPFAVALTAWVFTGIDLAGTNGDLGSGVASTGSGGLGAVSAGIAEPLVIVILLVMLPGLFVYGLVAPFAAVVSLYKSWLAAKASGTPNARTTVLWILISQMGGGVLTILIVPLLHLVSPAGPWPTIAAVLLFAFGLLMPIGFAAGVWQYRVLDLDPDTLPPAVS